MFLFFRRVLTSAKNTSPFWVPDEVIACRENTSRAIKSLGNMRKIKQNRDESSFIYSRLSRTWHNFIQNTPHNTTVYNFAQQKLQCNHSYQFLSTVLTNYISTYFPHKSNNKYFLQTEIHKWVRSHFEFAAIFQKHTHTREESSPNPTSEMSIHQFN